MDNLSACNRSASSLVSADSGIKLEERAGSAASRLNDHVSTICSPTTLLSESESVLCGFLGQTDVRIFTAGESVYERKQTRIPTSLLRGTTLFEEGCVSRSSLLGAELCTEPHELAICLERERIDLLVSPQEHSAEPFLLIATGPSRQHPPSASEIAALRQLTAIVERLYIRCRFALQEQLHEKLSVLASLTEQTGHALRNPLSALEALSLILPTQCDDRAFLKEFVEVVPQATRRVQTIVEQLLDACRQHHDKSETMPPMGS